MFVNESEIQSIIKQCEELNERMEDNIGEWDGYDSYEAKIISDVRNSIIKNKAVISCLKELLQRRKENG